MSNPNQSQSTAGPFSPAPGRFTYAAVPTHNTTGLSRASTPQYIYHASSDQVDPSNAASYSATTTVTTAGPSHPVVPRQVTEFPNGNVTYCGDVVPVPPYRANCQHNYSGNRQIKMKAVDGKPAWGQIDNCSQCGHVRSWFVSDIDEERYWNGWS